MNLEQLIDQFDLVTDTEVGLEQLRKLILKLAVRGKLTKQDSNDESVKALLERIEAEKERLYEERKIRKPRSLEPLKKDEIPFEIPSNWKWCKIGDIGKVQGGGTPKTSNNEYWAENGISWLTPADLNGNGKYISRGRRDISKKGLENSSTFLLPKGTVLFSSRAPIGYVAITEKDLATNQGFQSCIPYLLDMNSYIYYYLKYVGEILDERASGTTFKEVSGTFVANVEFPLPPLEEQQRIAQKIETLFFQVDELEQKVQQDRQVDERLQVAVLDDLQRAETLKASRQSWQRLTDHFDQIYRKPEHIDQLKQAILNEAVRGRLVPQDPNDEPAEKLLERIKEEKQRLYDEGEIRKPKDLPEIKDKEIPYELPKGWIWARVGNIAKVVEYGTSQKSHKEPHGVPMLRMGNIDEFGNLNLDNLKYVDAEIDDLPRLYLKDKDLLFNRTNSYELVGKMGLYHGEDDKYTFASYLIRVQLFHDLTSVEYLHNFINSENCRKAEIEPEITQQTNQANFNGTKLQHIRVPLPPLEEQKRIMDAINHLFAWCDDLKEKLSRSQQTGQRLLEALVNGVSKNEQVDSDGKS